jgi:hypothetical protein
MNDRDAAKILKAGINRFYDEGFNRWSRETVDNVIFPATADDPKIVELLREWSRLGYIRLEGSSDCYFEVLRPVNGT